MLKLKLIDSEVNGAMEDDKELYDFVSKTESIFNEMLNTSDVCINDVSDNGMVINGSINILKSILIMVAHERKVIFTILENQKTIMDKIKDVDRKIDNLIQMNKQ